MRGELTAAARREFDPEVTRLLAAAPSAVTVDMSDVTCLDVAWIEVLRQLRTRLGREGEATVQVSAASAPAREMLVLSGLAAELVMPLPEESAQVDRGARASTPSATGRDVAAGAGAVFGASTSRQPPAKLGPGLAKPPPLSPLSPRPGDTGALRKRWFGGSRDLKKWFVASAAGVVLLAFVALVPSQSRGLPNASGPGPSELECTTKYAERAETGIASDRDAFMRNCEAAGQAMLAGQVPASASTTASRKTSDVDLVNPTSATVEDTVATIEAPTSGAATPPSSRARRTGQSTSIAAATTQPAPTTVAPTPAAALTTIATTRPATTTTTTPKTTTTRREKPPKPPTPTTTTSATPPITTPPTSSSTTVPKAPREHGKDHQKQPGGDN